ncbi:MAG TPA: TetR/AcrR family transcriptional regulator [Bacillota bacterium]
MSVAKRRARERKQRRELIIQTAQQLFEEQGFDRTTVEAIAARAELGKGTIYSYFQSKEQIYIAILEKGLDLLKERMDQALQNPASAIDALHKMFDVFIEYHQERKDFVETLFVQVDKQNLFKLSGLVGGLKNKASVWVEQVAKVLAWGIERGEFKPVDIFKTAQIIVGMILGLIMQHETGQTPEAILDYRDTLFQLVLEGIRVEPVN